MPKIALATKSSKLEKYRGVYQSSVFYPKFSFFAREKRKEWDRLLFWYMEKEFGHDFGIELSDENISQLQLMKKLYDSDSQHCDIIIYGHDLSSDGEFLGIDITSDDMAYSIIADGVFEPRPNAPHNSTFQEFKKLLNENSLFSSRKDAEDFISFLNDLLKEDPNSIENYKYYCTNIYLLKYEKKD